MTVLRPTLESPTFQGELVILAVVIALASAGVSREGSQPTKPLTQAR